MSTNPSQKQSARKKKHQPSSPTKKVLSFGFVGLLIYGYTKSIVNFRQNVPEDVPTRAVNDIWYIIAASLINLVRALVDTSF